MTKFARFAAFLFCFLLMVGAGALIAGCSSSDDSAGSDSAAAETATESDSAQAPSGSGDIAAAEALIGQEMTMDEVEAALGPAKDFTLSAEGCERGVMQGIFYYDDYSVFSRTYDKGKTFNIVSVSD